jgi:hypothetical protein
MNMAELTAAEKAASAKADLEAKNKALAGKFMDQSYDWVETLVHKTWLPNASSGKVVGSVLEGTSGDAPVEHMVNLVRRAVYAHENRPILAWAPQAEYRMYDRVKGADDMVYIVETPGVSGAKFGDGRGTVVMTLEDPQPVAEKAEMASEGPSNKATE